MVAQLPSLVRRTLLLLGVSSLFFVYASIHTAFASFSDVSSGSTYEDALSYLETKGVIQGYPDGTFQPDRIVNRAEALKMLLVGLKVTASETGESTFPDLEQGAWYVPYVNEAFHEGYVKGYPDGTFKPGNPVNRVEAMKMLLEIANVTFDDAVQQRVSENIGIGNDEWYAKYVTYALDKNILPLTVDQDLHAGGDMTRGDIAEMLYRILYAREQGKTVFEGKQDGRISFYADKFEGRYTASGELYTQKFFTAAHRTLPFGTLVQVGDPDTKKAFLVKVNDRGPYVDDGLLDLTTTAFEQFYPLGKGIFQGEGERVGYMGDTFQKKFYSQQVFDGLTLGAPLPNMYMVGEFYNMRGFVDRSNVDALVAVAINEKGERNEQEFTSNNGSFAIPFYFDSEGVYKIGVAVKGDTPQLQEVTVYQPFFGYVTDKRQEMSAALTVQEDSNGLLVSWPTHDVYNMYKLRLQQGEVKKEFIINNGESILITKELLKDFTESMVKVTLFAGITSTGFSHDLYTGWNVYARDEVYFAYPFAEVYSRNNLLLTQEAPVSVSVGEKIMIKGKTTSLPLKNTAYLILPDGSLAMETIHQGGDSIIEVNQDFSYVYIPKEKGRYILELVAADNRPLYVMSVRVGNVAEVLFIPENRNFNYALLEDRNRAREILLELTNKDRKAQGLEPLELHDALNKIAQHKARDMAERDYFAHIDPDGVEVNDFKVDYNFLPPVAENIAMNTISLDFAYQNLRHSPTHLQNILSNNELLGIGVYKKDDMLYVVQEFSVLPIEKGEEQPIKNEIFSEVSELSFEVSNTANIGAVAQDWAELMADKKQIAFEFDDKSILHELSERAGAANYKVFVFSYSLVSQLKEEVTTKIKDFGRNVRVGIGIAQDAGGIFRVALVMREE